MVLVYSAVAGRVARSWLSGPILFVATGLVVGPLGLNVLRLEITANDLRVLAEAALAVVLFTDAARADLAVIRRGTYCFYSYNPQRSADEIDHVPAEIRYR